MNTGKNFEIKVLKLLKAYLIKKGYPEDSIKENYRLHNQEFDIAIVNLDEIIIEIYEIKSYSTFILANKSDSKFSEIQKRFNPNVNAFLVSIDNNNELCFLYLKNAIKTFESFYRAIKQYLDEDPDYTYFYRGHSSLDYDLRPSIYRNKNIEKEDILFKEAIRRNPTDFPNSMSTFEKLVKMQHYGLSTRLLDITTNPLIALYFACNNNDNKKDGEIYIFKIKKNDLKYFESDSVSVVSNIAKRPFNFTMPKTSNIEEFNKEGEIKLLLHEIKYEKPHFLNQIDPEDLERVFCVLPKLDNPRITKQSGAFFLYGITKTKENPAKFEEIPLRIIIDNDGKKNIIKELSYLGINKSALFPEIEHILEALKE